LKYKNAKWTNYDVKGIYIHANSQITQGSTDEYDYPSLSLTQNYFTFTYYYTYKVA